MSGLQVVAESRLVLQVTHLFRGPASAVSTLPTLPEVLRAVADIGEGLAEIASLDGDRIRCGPFDPRLFYFEATGGRLLCPGLWGAIYQFERETGCVGPSALPLPFIESRESLLGLPTTERTETFYLAHALFRLLTQRDPFGPPGSAENLHSIRDGAGARLSALREDAPSALSVLLAASLGPEPLGRPALGELAQRLREIADNVRPRLELVRTAARPSLSEERDATTLELLTDLSRRALNVPVGSVFPAYVVPLSAAEVRERAPAVVTAKDSYDHRTLQPVAGGLFDPALFGGIPVSASDSRKDLPDADGVVAPTAARFARISLGAPTLHPLFLEHLGPEIAERIGWYLLDMETAVLPAQRRALCEALEAAGLGTLVLRELPVVPPNLRPYEKGGGPGANDLYRRVLNHNGQVARLDEGANAAHDAVIGTTHRMLQRSLHALFENDELPDGHPDVVTYSDDGTPHESLRALCLPTHRQHNRGTFNLWRDLWLSTEIEALRNLSCDDASVPMPYRVRVARAVLFGMGFDLRPKAHHA